MAIRFRSSGCLFSIIASVVLTILLNFMIRGCSSVSRSASTRSGAAAPVAAATR